MYNYIDILSDYLDRVDLIGYAAARNTRRLHDGCLEFINCRERLISQYGHDETDKKGHKTGRKYINTKDPNFEEFKSEIEKYANIEHDIEIMKIPYSETIGKLSGSEILNLDWMLED